MRSYHIIYSYQYKNAAGKWSETQLNASLVLLEEHLYTHLTSYQKLLFAAKAQVYSIWLNIHC